MDEIEQRLRESTDACIKSYEAWRAKEKDGSVRESLHDAVHELRKVASRLEIEMAISERGEMSEKPLPIPPHRSSRRARSDGTMEDMDDNAGNIDPQAVQQNRNRGPNNNNAGRNRRPQQKQS